MLNQFSHRKRNDVYGKALRLPTGETIQQDNSGGLTVKNVFGQVIKTIDTKDNETLYQWSGDNQLIRAILPSGAVLDNSREKQCAVLPDGTLRVRRLTTSGQQYEQDIRLDGSSLIYDEKGRIYLLKANLDVQYRRLYAVLNNLRATRLITNDQRQNMCDAYHALVRRVALEEITDTQAAQTVFHINRLLESCGNSPLGAQVCFMLSHELMFFSALPDETENSDGLSVLIGHLFRYRPDHAAMLVAEMSMYKRYITASGITVKYTEELMHPSVRKNKEWATATAPQKRFAESNKFLRVVLVNIVEKSRMARRASKENLALLDEVRRALSTREFGRVFARELAELFEHVTGMSAVGLEFTARKEVEKLDRAIPSRSGHNSSVVA